MPAQYLHSQASARASACCRGRSGPRAHAKSRAWEQACWLGVLGSQENSRWRRTGLSCVPSTSFTGRGLTACPADVSQSSALSAEVRQEVLLSASCTNAGLRTELCAESGVNQIP